MLTLMRAGESDADAVLALYHACLQSPYTHWGTGYPTREEIDSDLSLEALWLLRQDGELAGAVSLLANDDVETLGFPFTTPRPACVVGRFCLHPSYQGKGLGKVFLSLAEHQAFADGYASVHLLCADDNPITRRLYTGAGYRHVADTKLYERTWLVYEKALTGIKSTE